MEQLSGRSGAILDRLRTLRASDAATHGGRVLSYVYDPGLAELDELAAEAMRLMQPVNGLDPTVFPSVAVLEREVIDFARRMLHGDDDTVGTVTSGGTESCMLAVKTARDGWVAARAAQSPARRPRIVAPTTVHAAFRKAAQCFGLDLDLVPVDADGAVAAEDVVARLGDDVALVVVSAPAYPFGVLDPVAEVAAAASRAGIPCHVDACFGGFALPWWGDLPAWDLTVAGVTSISADLHKYGYAPKGASVLLQRDRDRQRRQFFATADWPGYPVVNPTLLGSKSATALAAAWAIVQHLGEDGFAGLVASCRRATEQLHALIDGTTGLRVVGEPTGPLLAVAADPAAPRRARVDPHHWADRVAELGFTLQLQPGSTQEGGVDLPRTTHLTITPVTERMLPELSEALSRAADDVRGRRPADPRLAVQALRLSGAFRRELTAERAQALLQRFGVGRRGGGAPLPARMAPLIALVEQLPAAFAERLLIEVLARQVEPASGQQPRSPA